MTEGEHFKPPRTTMTFPNRLLNFPSSGQEGSRAAPGWFDTVIPRVGQTRYILCPLEHAHGLCGVRRRIQADVQDEAGSEHGRRKTAQVDARRRQLEG